MTQTERQGIDGFHELRAADLRLITLLEDHPDPAFQAVGGFLAQLRMAEDASHIDWLADAGVSVREEGP